ncbi:prolyl oligopeptidase family serine peptidase [Candidatus Poriferisocius sp.]|uniref:S9 family peptidase n=1 Tax=Candidatus Poriferisocius sp. TaxID=3101276 RepID=UPI003B017820
MTDLFPSHDQAPMTNPSPSHDQAPMTDSFPRLHARTRGFTLGAPRSFSVSGDGRRVAFLRSESGTDPVNRLWVLDTVTGTERLVADPIALEADAGNENLPPAERARRERVRESGGGIVAHAGDPHLSRIAFTLGDQVFLAEIGDDPTQDTVRALPTRPGAFDPRPSPDGQQVAYVSGTGLRVVEASATGPDRPVINEPGGTVSWGSPEFIAAEEMGRTRGFWWSPGSRHLMAARVDTAPVPTWYIASPADPAAPPTPMAYPAAGTINADVSLAILGLDGSRVEVSWDRGTYEYLARAGWAPRSNPVIAVQSRDQCTVLVLEVDPSTGATVELARQSASPWVELVPGTPAWMGEHLVTVQDRGTARRLVVDGTGATPETLQVRRVVAADERRVVFIASDDPTEAHVWQLSSGGELQRLTTDPGVHSAEAGGDTTVIVRAAGGHTTANARATGGHTTANVRAAGTDRPGEVEAVTPTRRIPITSRAATPTRFPSPRLAVVGHRELRTAVLYPSGDPGTGDEPLPVLLDPYGGPHAQRVLRAGSPYLVSQWFADQGFAVVITDGRGTPARGPQWERAVAGDLAHPVLEDQIDALDALAEQHPRLDLDRVAIRGWSFGGYLAALAVLARPDRFHSAIAGAPVTDWRLYDTHYTERYLGHPDHHPEAYSRTSLIPMAGNLVRPLLLICGLADDNVFAAHTLRLSQALFEAGRPHRVLPLPGITHMTPQEQVAENLLLLQKAFLIDSLGLTDDQ